MDQNLSAYIDKLNLRAKIFNVPQIDKDTFRPDNSMFPTVKAALLEQLEVDLSPENLSCDGEVRGAALRERAQFLHNVKAAVEALV